MKSIIQVKGSLNASGYDTIISNWVSADDFNALRIDYNVVGTNGLIDIEGSNDNGNTKQFTETYLIEITDILEITHNIDIDTVFDYYRVRIGLFPTQTADTINISAKFYNRMGNPTKCITTDGFFRVEKFNTLDFKIRNDGGVNVDAEVKISYFTPAGTAFKEDTTIILKSDTETAGKVIDTKGISFVKVEVINNSASLLESKIEGLLY